MGAAPRKQVHHRSLQAAAALLLCVAITGALLFSRLIGFANVDNRQYIPLTESNGITSVRAIQPIAHRSTAVYRAVPMAGSASAAARPLKGSVPGFNVTDKGIVWTGETDLEIFRVAYENDEKKITVRSGNGEQVIAPGTRNSFTFALENTASGTLDYGMDMEAYMTIHSTVNIPVKVRVSRDYDHTYLVGSETEFADVMSLNNVKDSGKLKKGYVMPYTLEWEWPFEGDDELDTILGNAAVQQDITLTIVINTEASVTPDDGSGVPKTGDTAQIGLWFTLLIGSSAGLLFLLLLLKRKGDEDEEA